VGYPTTHAGALIHRKNPADAERECEIRLNRRGAENAEKQGEWVRACKLAAKTPEDVLTFETRWS
jgi:phosphohistidine phosphatase SixA